MATAAAPNVSRLPEFRNEALTDFTRPENRERFSAGLAEARAELGREYDNRIGDKRTRAAKTFKSHNPARVSEVVGIHPENTAEAAREAVSAALLTFECWRLSQPEKRVEILLRAADLLRQRKPYYSAWLTLEVGKSFAEADADVCETIDFLEYYSRQQLRLSGPQPVLQLPGEKDEMVYIPLGVGAVIPPWNFPLAITAGMTAAAIVAGNTVVLKPSSDSPTVAAKMMEVFEQAGLPAGVVNLVTGGGGTVGEALVVDPRVRFVAFTGSKQVGLDIHRKAADTQPGQKFIKRTVLEMGGKDSIVVDADADFNAAVEGVAVSAFGYQGQKCSACSRAIVHEKIYDRFVEALVARTAKITVGDPANPDNYMGPVINERSLKNTLKYIEVGKTEGRLVHGGARGEEGGHFVAPTIFADIQPGARLSQEEIFAPVLAVIKCRDFDHGLEIANNTEYGLTGAVYTSDPAKLEKARSEFHVGNLYLNRKCTGAMVGAHPFGGFNMSGTDSKAGGPDYLLLFTQAKSIARKL
ncbi:MAG TPA: L-glutamate gamma-semialdehyde dehydrogenase [Terriglobales bacterium]|nr:L-glutamate gamma-semialdehyde dehydrogenase [Terriglobales bacterium]